MGPKHEPNYVIWYTTENVTLLPCGGRVEGRDTVVGLHPRSCILSL